MTEWNILDVLLILLVVAHALRGWQRGLMRGLLDLTASIGSLLLALRFYQPVARWLAPRVGWSEVWNLPAAFLLTAIAAAVLINVLGHGLLGRLPRRFHRRIGNRVLGLAPGLINGLIAAAIVSALLLAIPLPTTFRSVVRESSLANRLASYTERFGAALAPIFNDAIGRTLNGLMIRPDSNERVTLPYTVAHAPPAPELEASMLTLINRERANAGIAPLAPDSALAEVAREHSSDMFARGYFAHDTPEGRTPSDRIAAAGIPFRIAGENLALAPTLSLAHTGLMNSPGHRANILRREFGHVGIGIVDGGMRGLMVTQDFRD